MFVEQLSAKFPNMKFLATTFPSTTLNPTYEYSAYALIQFI